MTDCKTCELVARRDAGTAPLWDAILRRPGWDLVHSYNTSLEGWLVLVARRHITALADLSAAEATELGRLIRRVSTALHHVTGCEKTYLAQFAEHPDHRHVHVHIVPRASDHPAEALGPDVFDLIGTSSAEQVSPDRMNEIAGKIRSVLTAP